MLSEAELEQFWRAHEMSTLIAQAALRYLRDRDFDDFSAAVGRAYDEHCSSAPRTLQ